MIPDHRERHIIMTSMKCLIYLCDIEIKLYLTYKKSRKGKEKLLLVHVKSTKIRESSLICGLEKK
jgi:hypothetical protein